MNRGTRVLMIAVDGLDWPLLQALADAGNAPMLARLLAAGRSGPLAHPAPHHAATHWASVASGCTADRHGICHPFTGRPDGLLLAPAIAADLHAVPFWQRVWEAGGVAKVAGWPATLGTALPAAAGPGSCIVADGYAFAELGVETCWPLAPGAVVPASERASIGASRVHPDRLDRRHEGEETASRRRLAVWSSLHRLGRLWASAGDWQLIALRLDGLADVVSGAARAGTDPVAALRTSAAHLDALLTDCHAAGGPGLHLLLLTESSAPADLETRVEPATPTGLTGRTVSALRLPGLGGLAMIGPGVSRRRLGVPLCATQVHTLVLGLLGIENAVPEALPADALARLATPPAADPAAAAWLRAQGVAPVDGRDLRERARRLQVESLAGWAAAKSVAGEPDEAARALRLALTSLPAGDPARSSLQVRWAHATLDADGAVPVSMNEPAEDPVTDDFLRALAAFGARDWPTAETLLSRLVDFAPRWIAALAAGWRGRARLAQGDAADAERDLAAALGENAADPSAWIAWAGACAAEGRIDDAFDGLSWAIAALPSPARMAAARDRLRPPPACRPDESPARASGVHHPSRKPQ